MRHKKINRNFLIFAVLLLLISLPQARAKQLQYIVSEKCTQLFGKRSENTTISPTKELCNWIHSEETKREEAQLAFPSNEFLYPTEQLAQNSPFSFRSAKVIYYSHDTTNPFVWIDIGRKDCTVDENILLKNSPVLKDDCVVGVVEYVGEHASLVRLISSESVHIAVQVFRGGDYSLLAHINALEKAPQDWIFEEKEKRALHFLLNKMKEKIYDSSQKVLGKCFMRGSATDLGYPITYLKGVGFQPNALQLNSTPEAFIQKGDLLITSGLDGIFPTGLKIGHVNKIFPLKEGAFSYDIIVESIAPLDQLDFLYILPPSRLSMERQPSFEEKILTQIDENL